MGSVCLTSSSYGAWVLAVAEPTDPAVSDFLLPADPLWDGRSVLGTEGGSRRRDVKTGFSQNALGRDPTKSLRTGQSVPCAGHGVWTGR